MKNLLKKISIACLVLLLVSCNDDDDSNAQPTITDIAAANADFSILVTALGRVGLDAVLDGNGQYTVFAPTNAAFSSFLSANGFADIQAVPEATLKSILLNHVLGAEIKSNSIVTSYASTLSPINSNMNAPTISMFIQLNGTTVTLNGGVDNSGAVVTTADIDASNGVIHIINRVIALPTLVNHVVANPEFDTLQAVVTSGPNGTYGDQSAVLASLTSITTATPATLFAPNNTALVNATTGTAFAVGATPAQITKVLQYHVTLAGNVRSDQLTNNQLIPMITSPVQNTTVILGTGTVDIRDTAANLARVVIADIQCSNGVIHGINRVLQPSL